MAFKKQVNDITEILLLVLFGIPLVASTNDDCSGKSFRCLNSTHFMICVDLGGGVTITVNDIVIPCPSPTVCDNTNQFECDFPIISTPSLPVELLTTDNTKDGKESIDIPSTVTIVSLGDISSNSLSSSTEYYNTGANSTEKDKANTSKKTSDSLYNEVIVSNQTQIYESNSQLTAKSVKLNKSSSINIKENNHFNTHNIANTSKLSIPHPAVDAREHKFGTETASGSNYKSEVMVQENTTFTAKHDVILSSQYIKAENTFVDIKNETHISLNKTTIKSPVQLLKKEAAEGINPVNKSIYSAGNNANPNTSSVTTVILKGGVVVIAGDTNLNWKNESNKDVTTSFKDAVSNNSDIKEIKNKSNSIESSAMPLNNINIDFDNITVTTNVDAKNVLLSENNKNLPSINEKDIIFSILSARTDGKRIKSQNKSSEDYQTNKISTQISPDLFKGYNDTTSFISSDKFSIVTDSEKHYALVKSTTETLIGTNKSTNNDAVKPLSINYTTNDIHNYEKDSTSYTENSTKPSQTNKITTITKELNNSTKKFQNTSSSSKSVNSEQNEIYFSHKNVTTSIPKSDHFIKGTIPLNDTLQNNINNDHDSKPESIMPSSTVSYSYFRRDQKTNNIHDEVTTQSSSPSFTSDSTNQQSYAHIGKIITNKTKEPFDIPFYKTTIIDDNSQKLDATARTHTTVSVSAYIYQHKSQKNDLSLNTDVINIMTQKPINIVSATDTLITKWSPSVSQNKNDIAKVSLGSDADVTNVETTIISKPVSTVSISESSDTVTILFTNESKNEKNYTVKAGLGNEAFITNLTQKPVTILSASETTTIPLKPSFQIIMKNKEKDIAKVGLGSDVIVTDVAATIVQNKESLVSDPDTVTLQSTTSSLILTKNQENEIAKDSFVSDSDSSHTKLASKRTEKIVDTVSASKSSDTVTIPLTTLFPIASKHEGNYTVNISLSNEASIKNVSKNPESILSASETTTIPSKASFLIVLKNKENDLVKVSDDGVTKLNAATIIQKPVLLPSDTVATQSTTSSQLKNKENEIANNSLDSDSKTGVTNVGNSRTQKPVSSASAFETVTILSSASLSIDSKTKKKDIASDGFGSEVSVSNVETTIIQKPEIVISASETLTSQQTTSYPILLKNQARDIAKEIFCSDSDAGYTNVATNRTQKSVSTVSASETIMKQTTASFPYVRNNKENYYATEGLSGDVGVTNVENSRTEKPVSSVSASETVTIQSTVSLSIEQNNKKIDNASDSFGSDVGVTNVETTIIQKTEIMVPTSETVTLQSTTLSSILSKNQENDTAKDTFIDAGHTNVVTKRTEKPISSVSASDTMMIQSTASLPIVSNNKENYYTIDGLSSNVGVTNVENSRTQKPQSSVSTSETVSIQSTASLSIVPNNNENDIALYGFRSDFGATNVAATMSQKPKIVVYASETVTPQSTTLSPILSKNHKNDITKVILLRSYAGATNEATTKTIKPVSIFTPSNTFTTRAQSTTFFPIVSKNPESDTAISKDSLGSNHNVSIANKASTRTPGGSVFISEIVTLKSTVPLPIVPNNKKIYIAIEGFSSDFGVTRPQKPSSSVLVSHTVTPEPTTSSPIVSKLQKNKIAKDSISNEINAGDTNVATIRSEKPDSCTSASDTGTIQSTTSSPIVSKNKKNNIAKLSLSNDADVTNVVTTQSQKSVSINDHNNLVIPVNLSTSLPNNVTSSMFREFQIPIKFTTGDRRAKNISITSDTTQSKPSKANTVSIFDSANSNKSYDAVDYAYNKSKTETVFRPMLISKNKKNLKQDQNVQTQITFNCRNQRNRKYSDNHDCRKFYICYGLVQPIVGLCPVNTVFSETRNRCTNNLSKCIRNNEFKCATNGRFADFLKNNVYYICVRKNTNNYLRFKYQCIDGFYVNKTTVRCSPNKNTSNQSVSNESTSDSENDFKRKIKDKNEKLLSKINNNFKCKKSGKFNIPGECRKYYVCTENNKSEFRRRTKKCDSDEVFDKDKKQCVDTDSYECSTDDR